MVLSISAHRPRAVAAKAAIARAREQPPLSELPSGKRVFAPRVPVVQSRRPSAPHPTVTLRLGDNEILLPGSDAEAFQRWLGKLEDQRIFSDAPLTMAALRGMTVGPTEPDDDRPRIAIMASDPSCLLDPSKSPIGPLIERVRAMGCRPVLIPPCADLGTSRGRRKEALDSMLDGFDGLLGPGGPDVAPRICRAKNRFAISPNYRRDRFEADFVLEAMKRKMFLFGICRSHQLWNAALGGGLVQDVRKQGLASTSRNQLDDYGLDPALPFVVPGFVHRVRIKRGTRVALAAGVTTLVTNSLHHAAVKRAGRGLRVTAWLFDKKTRRYTIEATEAWNILTTQFHPEKMKQDPRASALFETLGRRAHVFRLLRDLGPETTVETLRERMRGDPRYQRSDYEWLERDLAPRLTLGRPEAR
jgi:putative glutamine amidotransferase